MVLGNDITSSLHQVQVAILQLTEEKVIINNEIQNLAVNVANVIS